MPGWSARVLTKKLAKPVQTDDGLVTTRVDRIVFTGRIAPEHFVQLPVAIVTPDVKAGTVLTFKVVQRYSNGKIVRWIGSPTADEPAPQVAVRPANAAILDYPAGAHAADQGLAHTMKGFVFGLPLGGLGAWLAFRRRRSTA
jgi:hypothetical protein